MIYFANLLVKSLSSYLFVSYSNYFYSVFNDHISCGLCPLVGSSGLEPPTSRLSGARSNHLSYEPMLVFGVSRSLEPFTRSFDHVGGDDGNRTHDPLLAGQVLSQLSYTPIFGVYSFE